MNSVKDRLAEFETRLDPRRPQDAGAVIIGYGEVSVVMGLPEYPDRVFKRTSGFRDLANAEAYRDTIVQYAEELKKRGITVIETEIHIVHRTSRSPVLYLEQPRIPVHMLGQNVLHTASDDQLREILKAILGHVAALLNSNGKEGLEVALDAQISNWSIGADGSLTYLDIGQPFLRRQGKLLIDPAVLRRPYPSLIRLYMRVVKLVERYIADYFDLRATTLDLLGNFIKEGAAARLEIATSYCATWAGVSASSVSDICKDDVVAYYRQDASTLEFAAQMRGLSKKLSSVLGTSYDYVLPGPVKR